MYIVTVSPIEIGLRDNLSYLSSRAYTQGSIVSVEVRKSTKRAIVISCESVNKTDIRRADFALKKIVDQTDNQKINKALYQTLQELSTAYLSSVGSIFSASTPDIPEHILEQSCIEPIDTNAKTTTTSHKNQHISHEIIVDSTAHRDKYIQQVIAHTIKNKKTLLIIAPTIIRAKKILRNIKEQTDQQYSIQDCIGTFSQTLRKKMVEAFMTKKQPDVIVVTPQYGLFFIPQCDECIYDDVQDSATMLHEPHVSLLVFLTRYAELSGKKMYLLGISIPQILYKKHTEQPKDFTLTIHAEPRIVVVESYVFHHPKLVEKMCRILHDGHSIFVLSHKKGLYGIVQCQDCKHIVRCEHCDIPVTLTEKHVPQQDDEQHAVSRLYKCEHCRYESTVYNLCTNCKGSRLLYKKPGSRVLAEQINEVLISLTKKNILTQQVTIISIDSDTTPARVKKILSNIQGPSIIVGTQYALQYISSIPKKHSISMSIIPHPEHVLSIPRYSILEDMRTLTAKLADIADGRVYTEISEHTQHALKHTISPYIDFLKNEQRIRTQVHVPPFGTYITVRVIGPKQKVTTLIESFQKDFEQFLNTLQHTHSKNLATTLGIQHSTMPFFKTQNQFRGAIRIFLFDTREEIIRALYEYISSLPPIYRIQTDSYGV